MSQLAKLKQRVWTGSVVAAFALAPGCGGDDDRAGNFHSLGGSSSGGAQGSPRGGVGNAAGGAANAGGQVGDGGRAGGPTLGGAAGESGAGPTDAGASGSSTTGGSSQGSGGSGAGFGGFVGIGGSGGAAECAGVSESCEVGKMGCCPGAHCYAAADGAFCARACSESSECNSSEPGCCAPLGENDARVCVPALLCE